MKWHRIFAGLCALLLSAVASAASITPNDLFVWVEKDFPSIFPKGPVTQVLLYNGCTYDARYYSTNGGVYIGVCRTNERVYTYNVVGTGLADHGPLEGYKCQARPDLCGAPGYAGNILFSDDGTNVVITPNYKGNLMWGLGADNKGFEVPVAEMDEVCLRSNRLGNWAKRGAPGCSKPEANGTLRVSSIANNDRCAQFVAWTKAGKELYLDINSVTAYKVAGLNAKVTACGVEYGKSGFRPNTISAVREPDGTASMVLDFGSNYLGGFYAPDGKSVYLDPTKQLLVFVLHGSKAGQGYGPGWGIGTNKDAAGNIIPPSIRWGWLEYKEDRFVVTIKNVACSDKGNVTVHAGSGPANNVVYEPGPKGFGLGWADLGALSVFKAGPGVIVDTVNYQVSQEVPFCVQK